MTEPPHFIDIDDVSPNELRAILSRARAAREQVGPSVLDGLTIGLLFEQPSTRTRVSFEAGIARMGGDAVFLASDDLQLGRGEPIADTARALSGYLDGIAARMVSHDRLLELAAFASVPVVNALTDVAHPCQTLADLMTIEAHCGGFDGVSATWIGDGNNVASSFTVGCAMLGVDCTVATPAGHALPDAVVERAASFGGEPALTDDPIAAVEGADVLYTDVWVSMSDTGDRAEKVADFDGFQVNRELLAHAPPEAAVMHCLPAHRGEEITDAVMADDRALIWTQAENRMYAQQGLLSHLLGGHQTAASVGLADSFQDVLPTDDRPSSGASG